MAKHKGKSRIAVINVNEVITLGALASGVVISTETDVFEREFWAVSTDINWTMKAHTAGEGPIEVGVAHGDYTVAELKENLDLTGMEDPGDLVAKEQGRRLVCRSATFIGDAALETLNDGLPIRTRLQFPQVGSAPQIAFWAQNLDTDPLTTGSLISARGKIYGRWM